MKKQIDFGKLEEKLNVASSLASCLVQELEIETTELEIIPPTEAELMTVDGNNEVFSTDSLKSDFIMIRQNVMKLITTGQKILESASVLDIGDLKAAQLTALSQLQMTLGSNMKLMVDLYKEICEIEKMRMGISGKIPDGSMKQLNSGNTVTNNIVFSGDTSSLLDIIKENHK